MHRVNDFIPDLEHSHGPSIPPLKTQNIPLISVPLTPPRVNERASLASACMPDARKRGGVRLDSPFFLAL